MRILVKGLLQSHLIGKKQYVLYLGEVTKLLHQVFLNCHKPGDTFSKVLSSELMPKSGIFVLTIITQFYVEITMQ